MKAVTHPIGGSVWLDQNRAALLLKELEPAAQSADLLYLRYAFVLQGVQTPILPALVLDDWGNEIKGLKLYEWVHKYGEQFPRAEIFGFTVNGRETQYFMRDLDLYEKLPCYLYQAKTDPISAGIPVAAVVLPQEGITHTQKGQRPPHLKRPLRSARVSWWLTTPTDQPAFDFSSLD